MAAPPSPSDIAREVLRLIAARGIPPTPDNFRTLYEEIAGESADDDRPLPDSPVHDLASPLPSAGEGAELPAPHPIRVVAAGEAGAIIAALRELLVVALDTVVPAVLGEQAELASEAEGFAAAVRASTSAEPLRALVRPLRDFAYRLELMTGDTAEVRAGLLNLFDLLLENIEEIVIDDPWLQGQLELLRQLVTTPATVRGIDEAERRLREIIYKQSQLKHNLVEAQRTVKDMLAGFVDQLAILSENTGSFQQRVSDHAARIAQARDITEISPLLDQVMRDSRAIQEDALRTRDELRATQEHAARSEQRITSLLQERDMTTRMLRHDPLTGALNQRGLEEAFEKESSRAQRRKTALCIALLDIDDFKRRNDTLGDQPGDDAVIHLFELMRSNLRPSDTIACLGEEKFIIVCPDSEPEQASAALVRLQRALTKDLFLAESRKALVTFSAGISAWSPGESMEEVLKRAEAAMNQARRSGRNRVEIAAGSQAS